MPKISVIVPVYNAEKYLRRCVDSILAQTFTDFELLLIDDGSKDNSLAICNEYAVKDTRVRVFHKENGGVSSARNMGLENAYGEWIEFIDSDDWIDMKTLTIIHSFISDTSYDLLYFDFIKYRNDSELRYETPESNSKLKILNDFILGEWTVSFNIVAKRNLYEQNTIRYNTKLAFNEDYNVTMKLLACAINIHKVPHALYYYDMTNVNSAMHSLTSENFYREGFASQCDVIDFYKTKKLYHHCKRSFKERLLKNNQWMLVDPNSFVLFSYYCGPCPDRFILSYSQYTIKQRIVGFLLLKHCYIIPKLLLFFRNRDN